jgi:hypothetical protein
MLPPLFFILSAWMILFIAFAGIGLGVRRAFGLKNFPGADQILDGFWMGWPVAIFFLQIWHLFSSINLTSFLIIFLMGAAGWFLNRRALKTLIAQKESLKGSEKILLLIFAVLALLTAIMASRPSSFYDAGLYYVPSINWTLAYPITPGLGNLHGRLAFNQSSFLYAALLEAWSGKASHLANSLLFNVLLAEIFLSLRNLLDRRHQLRMHEIFNILLFPAVWHQVFLSFFPSFSPDQVVFLLCVLIASRFLRFLEDAAVDAPQKDYLVFTLAVLVFCGTTVKATFLIFGGACLAVVCGNLLRIRKDKITADLVKIFSWSSAMAALSLGPWFLRSVILTGYPVYPAPWGGFPVDWRLPHVSVERMWHAITLYAQLTKNKMPGDIVNFFFFIPCGMAGFGILATLLKKGWNKKNAELNRKIWPFFIPGALAALHWYVSAPNLRFAMGFFWILGAGFLLQWLNGLKNPRFLLVTYMVLSGIFVLAQNGATLNPATPFIETERKNEAQKDFKCHSYKTLSGLTIYVPAEDDRCWNAALPCTPYPHPNLSLRDPQNIKHGFRIEPREDTDATVGFYSVEPPVGKNK